MYHHILLATDGSDLSHKAVEHALALAKLSHAAVTAVNIAPNYPRSYFEGSTQQDPQDITRIEQGWIHAAQAVLDKVVAEGAAVGISVTAKVIKQFRAPKVIIFHFKRRKGFHKKKGHRQNLTQIEITGINA